MEEEEDSLLLNDPNNDPTVTSTTTNTTGTSLFNLPSTNSTSVTTSGISPLEQEVLDEYARLLNNMNRMSSTLATLASGPMTVEIADGLRLLERKVTSVYTLMKASVYSIVLQQGQQQQEESRLEDDG